MGRAPLARRDLAEFDRESGGQKHAAQPFRQKAPLHVVVAGDVLDVVVAPQGRRDDVAARPEYAGRLLDRERRIDGVRQARHEHDVVERSVRVRQRVHVCALEAHVSQMLQPVPTRSEHGRAVIDARHRLRPRGDQLGKCAITGRDVEHVSQPHQPEQAAQRGLPGAPGRVVALHPARHGVGPRDAPVLQALPILFQQRVVGRAVYEVPRGARVVRHGGVQAVVRGRAGTPVAHQRRVAQLAEMRRDA